VGGVGMSKSCLEEVFHWIEMGDITNQSSIHKFDVNSSNLFSKRVRLVVELVKRLFV
jgi:hypothetical protein